MTLEEFLEGDDDKARFLRVFYAFSVTQRKAYEENEKADLDEFFGDKGDQLISHNLCAEPGGVSELFPEDELWVRPLVEIDPYRIKVIIWLIERLQYAVNPRSINLRMINPEKSALRSYEYFCKIVVPAIPGVWNTLHKDGRVMHFMGSPPQAPSHEYLRDLSQSERDIARDRFRADQINADKCSDEMKARGFPYSQSFDEYIRFLRNNFDAMNIAGFRLTLDDILELFAVHKINPNLYRRAHTYIVGRSGSGKSELIKGLCFRLKTDFVLLDPHGDLADDLSHLKALDAVRIAPHEQCFVINPFDIADKSEANRELVAQEITDLIAELVEDSGLSRLMTTIMFPVVYTLLKLPYADFKMLIDCINPNTGKVRLKSLRDFVEPHHNAIWTELEGDTYDTSKQSVFNRLQSLLNYRLVTKTLCGKDDFARHFERLLDKGTPAVVSLPIPTIGEAVAVTIGRFFATRMQIWAKRRQALSKDERKPVVLVMDEFHNFMSHATAQTLDQYGRKFGLFMMLAHQHVGQISDREIRGAVMTNTVNKIAGMSNTETRQVMAKEMGLDADSFEGLRAGNFWRRFEKDERPFRFYARMLSDWRGKKEPTYCPSANTGEMIDGWEGFENTESEVEGAPTLAMKGKDAPPIPQKGFTPKFDI